MSEVTLYGDGQFIGKGDAMTKNLSVNSSVNSSVNLFRVIVQVDRIDRAAEFYGKVLGTPGIRVTEGRHYFDCGGTILACVDPGAEHDTSYRPAPTTDFLYFAVEDVEAALAACKEAGGEPAPGDVHDEPACEIVRRPWGERSFYWHDPFGNKICFVDRATTFTGR
jgi:catechol 2,3-dioxygenase-like lactoylglutathione lyase family enzyme